MTSAQCLAGVIWAACAIEAYEALGMSGVILAALMAAIGGLFSYRWIFRRKA